MRSRRCPGSGWRRRRASPLVGGLVFYALIVELSFRLDDLGVDSTGAIGAISAIGSLGTAAGALSFGRLAARGPAVTISLAFAVSGVGLIGLGLAPAVPLVVVAAVVTGLGNGLLLPALLTWALGSLSFEQRGRGTGCWTAAVFLGQFICPLVVLALSDVISGLGSALVVVGVVAVAVAIGVRVRRPVVTAATSAVGH